MFTVGVQSSESNFSGGGNVTLFNSVLNIKRMSEYMTSLYQQAEEETEILPIGSDSRLF